jgi:hypothetical protein
MFGRQGSKASVRDMTPEERFGACEESVPGSGGTADREASRTGGVEARQAGCEAETGWTGDVGHAAPRDPPRSSSLNPRFGDFSLIWIAERWAFHISYPFQFA